MKHALLIGCGNKRGERIIKGCESADHIVTNVGSSVSSINTVKNINIDWKDLNLIKLHKILKNIDHQIDFLFFNQNASSLSQIDFTNSKQTIDMWKLVEGWTRSYWLSCQLPYFVIQTLGEKISTSAKIGWMLSGYIDKNKEGVADHADYSGYKFTNYLIMKNFAKKYECFGVDPDFETTNKIQNLITDICNNKIKCNGQLF